MKITLNNFEQVFGGLETKMQVFDDIKEDDIKRVVDKLKESINDIHGGGKQLKDDNAVLKIGIVGQVKAGKSSFLNSLFFKGENVLPKASTPMTAGLTVLRYGDENSFAVEYYNKKEWQVFEDRAKTYDDMARDLGEEGASLIEEYKTAKEWVANCGRNAKAKIKEESQSEEYTFYDIQELKNVFEKYVGANGEYTSVTKCLVINLHDERLKDIQIVDTPGVNDPVLSREQRTREFLRGCHGVFLLSPSDGFFNTTDVSFLTNRIGSQGIGTVVVIASKFDSVLQALSVATQFKGNLGDAIDDVKEKLKSQMDGNLANKDFKGDYPKLDFSSGIGYSIAKKDPSEWDDTERQTVSQMRKYYPVFFGTNEDARDSFLELSRIDDIKAEYIDDVFLKNKDGIIKKKVDAYFENSLEQLKKEFKKEIDAFSIRIASLEKGDLDNLKDQRAITETIIKEIKSDINTLLSRAESIADLSVKECLNDFRFRWSGKLYTFFEEITFLREGVFNNTRSFKCSFEKVDTNAIINEVCDSLDKSVDHLHYIWKSKTSILSDLIQESVNKVITENEIKDKKGCLDSKMLRNVLDDILEAMRSENTLDTHSVTESFRQKLTDDLNGKNELKYTKPKCKQSEAEVIVRTAAEKCKREIATSVNTWISAVHSVIVDVLGEARKSSIGIFKDKKGEFINGVSEKMNEALSQLEKDLKNKEEKLAILKNVHGELIKIEAEL